MDELINGKKEVTQLKKTKKRLQLKLLIVAIFLIGLILAMLLKIFIFHEMNISASIEKKAEAAFRRDIIIPEFKEYPITFASITMPSFLDHPSDLLVSYSANKAELDPALDEESERVKWETNQDSELLYGPYSGKELLRIEYRVGSVYADDFENKIINGVPVQYNYMEKESGEFIFATINFNDAAYTLTFMLDKEFTKNDAHDALGNFTKQLKQK